MSFGTTGTFGRTLLLPVDVTGNVGMTDGVLTIASSGDDGADFLIMDRTASNVNISNTYKIAPTYGGGSHNCDALSITSIGPDATPNIIYASCGGHVGLSTSAPEGRLDVGDGDVVLREMSAPATLADACKIYVKDDGGTAHLYVKDGAGTEYKLSRVWAEP